jgi:hypothetical protein
VLEPDTWNLDKTLKPRNFEQAKMIREENNKKRNVEILGKKLRKT